MKNTVFIAIALTACTAEQKQEVPEGSADTCENAEGLNMHMALRNFDGTCDFTIEGMSGPLDYSPDPIEDCETVEIVPSNDFCQLDMTVVCSTPEGITTTFVLTSTQDPAEDYTYTGTGFFRQQDVVGPNCALDFDLTYKPE